MVLFRKSPAPEYDFFYLLRGSSVEGSPFQQSLPTLRHLEPKFPIILALRVHGEVFTFIDLRLEKIWLVEHCHTRRAPLRALNEETFVRCGLFPLNLARRIAANIAKLPELLQ